MAAETLTVAEFIEEVGTRLDGEVSKADIKRVLKAVTEEATECLANGYKVSIPGLVSITPRSKPGRKKGTEVRNPFDGTTKKLKADEPDKFVVKAKASSSIVKAFPSVKTKDGIALVKKLKPKKK